MARTYELHEHLINARPGERVEVNVDGFGPSGHLWSVEADPSRVRVVDHRVEADESAFGAGGHETFVLEPVAEGETTVTFRLAAPWEDQAAETHTIKLRATTG